MKFARRKKKKRANPLGQRRRKMFRLKVVLFVFVVMIIVGIFAWLLRLPEVVINDIVIAGNNVTKTEEIEKVVKSNLSGSYFLLVPKNSEFFLPKTSIESDIVEGFTRIETAKAELRGGKSLYVEVRERSPHSLWCGIEYVDTEAELGNCYFMDAKSYIYAKAPDFTGNVFFKYFGGLERRGENTPTTTPLGGTFMDEVDFASLEVLTDSFRDVGYLPSSYTKVDDKDISLRMESGVEVLYGKEMKVGLVLDNLQSVIESDVFREMEQEKIEYIDLRFGSKVYYKLIGEEAAQN